MRRELIVSAALLAAMNAAAQAETPDTVVSQQLEEITIEAPKVVRKADMDVYHPSKSAVSTRALPPWPRRQSWARPPRLSLRS